MLIFGIFFSNSSQSRKKVRNEGSKYDRTWRKKEIWVIHHLLLSMCLFMTLIFKAKYSSTHFLSKVVLPHSNLKLENLDIIEKTKYIKVKNSNCYTEKNKDKKTPSIEIRCIKWTSEG